MIEIGVSLAAEPLPHHPASGVRTGRFRSFAVSLPAVPSPQSVFQATLKPISLTVTGMGATRTMRR